MLQSFKISLFIAFFFGFAACQKNKEPDYDKRTSYFHNSSISYSADSNIICATYNIHLGFNAFNDPWDLNTKDAGMDQVRNIAAILRSTNADIIALQEVPRNRYNAIVKNFLETLAAELNMNFAFGAHGYNDPYGVNPTEGEWGTAILTKFKIEGITNHEVEFFDRWEKRSLINATLKINDSTRINAISLHHLPSDQGIPNTASYVQTLSNDVLLMGDYNYIGEIVEFTNIGLSDVDSTYMIHGVDRIFLNKQKFQVLEIGGVLDSNFISDHSAHFAKLRFK